MVGAVRDPKGHVERRVHEGGGVAVGAQQPQEREDEVRDLHLLHFDQAQCVPVAR